LWGEECFPPDTITVYYLMLENNLNDLQRFLVQAFFILTMRNQAGKGGYRLLESLNEMKFIIVALNLILFYIVLRKLLFKRITDFMENRTNSIRSSLDDAAKQKAEAAELKQSYEDKLRSAKTEGETIVNEAVLKAGREHDRLVAEARQEAEAILAKAREEIEHERAQMIKDVRGQVAGLALAAASKVMEANMDTESNKVLVNKFIDEAGAA
jgi:F-type H+-transporting ATPase subunit b